MNEDAEKRYVRGSQIASFHNGALYDGKDLFLNRPVILYAAQCQSGQSAEGYILKLSHRASFSHEGFHHILDTSFDHTSVLVILQFKPGKLFIEEFQKKIWTFSSVITLIADLGVSMLDAMEQQITGFSIGVENLWMSEKGQLCIINYWDEGEPQTQGAIGLCRLLFLLFSGANKTPGPFEALHTHLERIHIPAATAEQKKALVHLIRLVCQGEASLSTLIFGLRSLPAANQTEEEKVPTRFYLWIGAGVFSLVFIVFLIWLITFSPLQNHDASVTPNDSIHATRNAVPTPTQGTKQIQPTKQPGTQQTDPEQNKEVIIPNLIGLTQADAEKQALSSGLHYNYILQANPQTPGSVFKQDPEPGIKGVQGDKVTFWVSK